MIRIALLIATLTSCAICIAQTYPSRAIRVIVPYSAGIGVDIVARTVGRKLSERLGQPVVVDNRPGASGSIGINAVAKAAPDGYTLVVVVNTFVTNPALTTNAGYDPLTDFTPLALLGRNGMVLVIHPSLPARSVKELIAYAAANPGKVDYASVGVGSPQHLALEMIKHVFGVNMVHIPHKGSAEANLAVMTGQVGVMMMPVNIALAPVRAGRILALAVGSGTPLADLPEVRPLTELGAPGFNVDVWYGLLAPAGTPRAIAELLHREVMQILAMPDVRDTSAKLGITFDAMSAAEFAAHVRQDYARWQKLIKDAGIKAE